ncbi:MAG: hypothetical protein MUR46_05415 [Loktanella sp.]|jgi:hypothetical protein|nr:hypothetical protein [Loktanella sp.]MDO7606744.1 hypothetical protein [Loktanella sp.]MDO7621884.1 hypothetical protein [Loktanella sp.]MDO7624719.1 hypothetical protein [Loktanella sp.]MDO7663986.1 hypothetical protein [Loktanella sp.]
MFTIEHEFDSTIITLVDEDKTPLLEDAVINVFEDRVTLSQWDSVKREMVKITLSISQTRDLEAALDLPEGVYRLRLASDAPEE